MRRACGWWNVIALPYYLPDGYLSLATIIQPSHEGGPWAGKEHVLYWDWQQETIGPASWRDIRYLPAPSGWTMLTFLGLDDKGRWWIGIVHGPCESVSLYALLPVSGPKGVFLEASGDGSPALMDYWVVDNGTLTVYRWVDGRAVPRWSLENVLGDSVSPHWMDMTGDGQSELVLYWSRQETQLTQIYQPEGEGYRLVGEIESGRQFTDVDGDGLFEFLRPQPPQAPKIWEVYGWNGTYFEWRKPLARPTAQPPAKLDEQALPPLPADFYFSRQGNWWLWPRDGGALRSVKVPPVPQPMPCASTAITQPVLSWSPDCHFGLTEIYKYEGSSFGILNIESGQVTEISHSFTYVKGYSTFTWDPASRFIVHARADGDGRLDYINLYSGTVDTRLLVNSGGIVGPTILKDGTIGFTIQGAEPHLYPPFGVYLLTPDRKLHLLADIPPIDKQTYYEEYVYYGTLMWSPDQNMFLFYAPLSGYQSPPYRALLLGMADGSAVWNLNATWGDAQDFQWRK